MCAVDRFSSHREQAEMPFPWNSREKLEISTNCVLVFITNNRLRPSNEWQTIKMYRLKGKYCATALAASTRRTQINSINSIKCQYLFYHLKSQLKNVEYQWRTFNRPFAWHLAASIHSHLGKSEHTEGERGSKRDVNILLSGNLAAPFIAVRTSIERRGFSPFSSLLMPKLPKQKMNSKRIGNMWWRRRCWQWLQRRRIVVIAIEIGVSMHTTQNTTVELSYKDIQTMEASISSPTSFFH